MLKMGKLQKELEKMAPDLKLVLTPHQQATAKSAALRNKVIGGVLGILFLVILILNTAAPQQMAWGKVYVNPNTTLYNQLQIAGLVTLGVSWFVEWRCMAAFNVRADYLKQYYKHPLDSRPARSEEQEYKLLKQFPYFIWREPLAMSFHWMSVSAFLLAQSWFLLIFQVMVVVLNEIVIIGNDLQWKQWFLPSAYERYFNETGGQWNCTCLNGCNRAVMRRRAEKFEHDGALDQTNPVSEGTALTKVANTDSDSSAP